MNKSNRKAPFYAVFAYLLVSCFFFGRYWLFQPSGSYIGNGSDPLLFTWVFKWWLYVLQHHVNPFYIKTIWAPTGSNLMLTTNIPALSFIFLPVTYLFGGITSLNVALTLGPVFSAWTMYLFLRWQFKQEIPAWFGGYLYGFSSFMITHVYNGHVNLVWTIALPLLVWLICANFNKTISHLRFTCLAVLCLLFQFLTSKELFILFTMALAFWALLSCLFNWSVRAQIMRQVLRVILAYIITLVILSPLFVITALLPSATAYHPPQYFSTDLLSFFIPTQITLLGGNWFEPLSRHFASTITEQSGYLSIPLLIILFLLGFKERQRLVRLLLGFIVFFALLSLGPFLYIAGKGLLLLPWFGISFMPLMMYVLPARYTLLIFFACAVLLVIWLKSKRFSFVLRYLLLELVIIFLLPNFAATNYRWGWQYQPLSQELLKIIPKDARVLVLSRDTPLMNRAALWNLDNNQYMQMTSGNLGPGATSTRNATAVQLFSPHSIRKYHKAFIDYFKESHSSIILVAKSEYDKSYRALLKPLISKRIGVGDIYVIYVKPNYFVSK